MIPNIATAAALLACIIPISASAEMPNYEVDAECRQVAGFGGTFSESTMQGCLRMEQSAYDALRTRWDTLPPDIRAECDQVARFGGVGSFSTLQGCVNMELDAARANRDSKFQR
jgi:hypothetical protein